jgi:glucokinase
MMDASSLSDLARPHLIDAVAAAGEISVSELADVLLMPLDDVLGCVKKLVAGGALEEIGGSCDEVGSDVRIGLRRATAGVIAVDLGGTKSHAALADYRGSVLAEDLRPTDRSDAVGTVVAAINALRTASERRGLPIAAIAIGIPAVIDPRTGLIVDGPNVGWSDFDLQGRLDDEVPEPILLDNDVNFAALGHAQSGVARGVEDFVTLAIGTGVGAAIVSGGRLIRGRRNAAGEIGRLVTRPGQLDAPADSVSGLEATASGRALTRQAEMAVNEGRMRVSLAGSKPLSAEDVFSAEAVRNPAAELIVEALLDDLATAVIAFATIVDPELVILDGSVGCALEPYIGRLSHRIARRLAAPPRICVSTRGVNAALVGGVASALSFVRREKLSAESELHDRNNLGTLPRY